MGFQYMSDTDITNEREKCWKDKIEKGESSECVRCCMAPQCADTYQTTWVREIKYNDITATREVSTAMTNSINSAQCKRSLQILKINENFEKKKAFYEF
jgi:hypothetical protein